MRLNGTIMQANALAALALGEAVGLAQSAMLDALQTFRGMIPKEPMSAQQLPPFPV